MLQLTRGLPFKHRTPGSWAGFTVVKPAPVTFPPNVPGTSTTGARPNGRAPAVTRTDACGDVPTVRVEGRPRPKPQPLWDTPARARSDCARGRVNCKGHTADLALNFLNGYRPGGTGSGAAGANASFTTRITFSRLPSTTGTRPPSSSRASSTFPARRSV